MASRTLSFLTALVCFGGCIDDQTGVPQPQPVPDMIRKSTPAMTDPAGPPPKTLVVGLAGAVRGPADVFLRNTETGVEAKSQAPASGSFALTVVASTNQTLELRYRNADGESDPLELRPGRQSYGPELGPPAGELTPPVSEPDTAGMVTVTNDSGTELPLFLASARTEVIVSNATQGHVATGQTDAKGLFSLSLPGAKGDLVTVLLADLTDASATSDFLSFFVP